MPVSTVRRLVVPVMLAIVAAIAVITVAARNEASNELSEGPVGAERVRVVATTGMIADLVRMIAGDRVELVQLIASGVDPHLYAPTRSDILRLESAQVILHNGFLLEGRLGEAITRAATPSRTVRAVAEVVVADGYAPLRDNGETDPHLWMDVAAWAQAARVVGSALAEVDAAHAAEHRAAADRVATRLTRLHGLVREAVETIPAERRMLVTAHDAFAYFGRAYDVEVHGIQGISTESEAGVRRITELTDLIVARRLPAVFAESTVTDRSVKALVEAAGARGHRVALGGELYSDAMGPDGTRRGTYVGMIDHNVSTIVRALGGRVPEGGLQTKLDAPEPTPQ